MRLLCAVLLTCVAAPPAALADTSPYAGEQSRAIKSLGPAEVEALLRGDGMGSALAAELNHYPGPRHALQLADDIGLSPEQGATVRALEAEMTAAAQALGRELIANESELDALFAAGRADEASLERLVGRSAELQGRLRLTHLDYHLRMRELLTPHQIALYDRLRGYGSGSGGAAHGHRHGG
jgi:Spy/CpxP family protein refolding chaperone